MFSIIVVDAWCHGGQRDVPPDAARRREKARPWSAVPRCWSWTGRHDWSSRVRRGFGYGKVYVYSKRRLIFRRIDRSICPDRWIDWLIGWLIDWRFDWLINRVFDLLIVWLVTSYDLFGFTGGHLNPALSVAFTLFGRLSWKKLIVYLVAQYVGALFAAAVIYATYFGKGKYFSVPEYVDTSFLSLPCRYFGTLRWRKSQRDGTDGDGQYFCDVSGGRASGLVERLFRWGKIFSSIVFPFSSRHKSFPE